MLSHLVGSANEQLLRVLRSRVVVALLAAVGHAIAKDSGAMGARIAAVSSCVHIAQRVTSDGTAAV
jgi:hypothetical protein